MKKLLSILPLLITFSACDNSTQKEVTKSPRSEIAIRDDTVSFVTFECSPSVVQMFWKADDGNILKNFDTLDTWLRMKQGKQLIFAMNGGMFMEDNSPLGLYIENGRTLRKLNTRNGSGNFYMRPNAVFFITKNGKAGIASRETFIAKDVSFATQSGPMVLIGGSINQGFTKGSTNLNIRNGVGILPNGNCLFVMSKGLVNFYDLARFFKDQGCENALYLDGAISRTYLPEKGFEHKGGNFGVMIGVLKQQ